MSLFEFFDENFWKNEKIVRFVEFLLITHSSCYDSCTPGRGVTANMPLLGRGDSGFESRRPDTKEKN